MQECSFSNSRPSLLQRVGKIYYTAAPISITRHNQAHVKSNPIQRVCIYQFLSNLTRQAKHLLSLDAEFKC